jgi:hypothetical protein
MGIIMDTSLLLSIYKIAASVSTPLALGAFVAALFFGAGLQRRLLLQSQKLLVAKLQQSCSLF